MRTVKEIANNCTEIRNAMTTIEKQIWLLNNEYQQYAKENCGHRLPEWDALIGQLESANKALNTLMHMEYDAQDFA